MAKKYDLNPKLRSLFNILDTKNREYLFREVTENLDDKSQQRLYEIVQTVLSDEVNFLLEIEIRRQKIRESEELGVCTIIQ